MATNHPFRNVDEHGRVNNLPKVEERKTPWWLRKGKEDEGAGTKGAPYRPQPKGAPYRPQPKGAPYRPQPSRAFRYNRLNRLLAYHSNSTQAGSETYQGSVRRPMGKISKNRCNIPHMVQKAPIIACIMIYP